MRGHKPDLARAGRLTGHRPLPAPLTPASTDLGDCPAGLTGAGRDLWIDAAAFFAVNGRSNRVYRHALRLLCQLTEDSGPDAGINRVEAIRRLMAELQLTPASSARGGSASDTADTGPARLLALVAQKRSRG